MGVVPLQLGNEIVVATLPQSGNQLQQPCCALYGADANADAEENVSDIAINPPRSDLAERAVIYASNVPGRSYWAFQADADALTLAQVAGVSNSTRSTSTSASVVAAAATKGVKDKLPLPHAEDALGVMLKIYDLDSAEGLQAADIVNVVGILDRSPLPHTEWASSGGPQAGPAAEQEQAEQLFPSLHVVTLRKVPDVWSAPQGILTTDVEAHPSSSARQEILKHLTAILEGDADAAEWLLLSLIASIHTRKSPFALGHLSLRLLLGPGNSAKVPASLQIFLEDVLPTVVPLDLTLETLNDASIRFSPKSDADSGALLAGRLQLAPGTTLLVNESIQEGRLVEHGLRNLQSLSEMVKTHTLRYLFPFSPVPYVLPIDTGVVFVSGAGQPDGAVGFGGLIQVDVDVAVASPRHRSANKSEGNEGEHYISAPSASLAAMRRHLLSARSLARTLRVGEDVAESIQKDFVASRTVPAQLQSQSQEDLLRRMDIARLICASHGRASLRFADYTLAKEMDIRRRLGIEQRRKEQQQQRGRCLETSQTPATSASGSIR